MHAPPKFQPQPPASAIPNAPANPDFTSLRQSTSVPLEHFSSRLADQAAVIFRVQQGGLSVAG
ncbi:hypothetical protein, partial [Cerasicoccus frondis]|uniref:hypothetical protein n=1 Tax=Cerasicoccus frondis TaxID=490090 RepID=UPI0028528EF8